MSDSETDPLRGLLSEFALGPAWARTGGDTASRGSGKESSGGEPRSPRHHERERDGRRPFQKRDQRGAPPRREDIPPAEGVRVTVIPDPQAVHLISREVHQVARVYSLFNIAETLLAERSRCRAVFEAGESRPPLLLGKLDESLFLTRDEAVRHLWHSDLRKELLDEETVEAEPPAGNFQSVARCGLSGEWLGPPNFHSYQTNLRRLHRERFSHLPFEVFSSKVRTERGEEAVNAWLETTKQKTRWRLKGDEDAPWIEDRAEAERALSAGAFDKAFEETRKAEISAAIPGKNLSPSLLASLRIAGSHARKHPTILIPAICRALEAEHLPVFKRQGKLHTGPARPHALAADAVLAERPGQMVAWIRANTPAKLAGLWEAVLPEGSTAPPAEYAADLFWLLQQGHILLYTDDTLVVQEVREPAPSKKSKEPKKSRKPSPESSDSPAEAPLAETLPADLPSAEPSPAEETSPPAAPEASEASTAAPEQTPPAGEPEEGASSEIPASTAPAPSSPEASLSPEAPASSDTPEPREPETENNLPESEAKD